MNNINDMLDFILYGDYGLLTTTPQYLLLILFPLVVAINFLSPFFSSFVSSQPFLKEFQINPHLLAGLGCTTAAIASLPRQELSSPINTKRFNVCYTRYLLWVLTLLIPCSAKLSTIGTFGAMVDIKAFVIYLLFAFIFLLLLHILLEKTYDSVSPQYIPKRSKIKLKGHLLPTIWNYFIAALQQGFTFIKETGPTFCIGSVVISILSYYGLLSYLEECCKPIVEIFLNLPKESADIFILNIFKRDFGAASLLSLINRDAVNCTQLIQIMIMLTFSPPCFNSGLLILKREKLPFSLLLWLGSFFISIMLGKLVALSFSIYFLYS